MSGGLDRIAAEKALRPVLAEARELLDRLWVPYKDGHEDLKANLANAIDDGDDGARLKAYIVQARIALGDEPAPEHVPTRMMAEEEANMRELVARSPRVVPAPRAVKPPRVIACTVCGYEVLYWRLKCPECGAKVLTDPAVRALVLAARAALPDLTDERGHDWGRPLHDAIQAVEGRTTETKEETT